METLGMTARQGRATQVYSEGKRMVVGCVPIRDSKVLLISSRKGDEWILPKGGWENDETKEQSAAREAWEEAGVTGTVGKLLGEFTKKESLLSFYLLNVELVKDTWPEMNRRHRKWVDFNELSTICIREGMKTIITNAINSLNNFE